MTTYTLVQNDQGDWIGLYSDGWLIEESHSFGASHLLKLVGVKHDLIWDVPIGEDESGLPEALSEVVKLGGSIRTVL